jgi:hypothetical protein
MTSAVVSFISSAEKQSSQKVYQFSGEKNIVFSHLTKTLFDAKLFTA